MRILISLGNIWIFVTGMIWHGVPVWKWGRAWREIEQIHRQDVHKTIWELKKQGRVVERDGRLYPNDN